MVEHSEKFNPTVPLADNHVLAYNLVDKLLLLLLLLSYEIWLFAYAIEPKSCVMAYVLYGPSHVTDDKKATYSPIVILPSSRCRRFLAFINTTVSLSALER